MCKVICEVCLGIVNLWYHNNYVIFKAENIDLLTQSLRSSTILVMPLIFASHMLVAPHLSSKCKRYFSTWHIQTCWRISYDGRDFQIQNQCGIHQAPKALVSSSLWSTRLTRNSQPILSSYFATTPSENYY